MTTSTGTPGYHAGRHDAEGRRTDTAYRTEAGYGTAPEERGADWARGGVGFAGVLMIVYGVIAILQGIAGIARNNVYVPIGNYVYEFTTTTWGWIHLVLGVFTALVGYGVMKGMTWARVSGIALASLVVIANFLWLPYQPLFALATIAIGVFIIWALARDGSHSSM
ncbi:hypothetical protein SRB5_45630 [Streptomyces sp. RB5]|uniref:DUF7144 domain-containing protein n=1 Tax=Streptomyces smaragdinus TaxID=2585196 RepID=A0A7K0CLN6_9ACTN|nr:hypothetical protein [Streptomyces smaragdinus]MQY14397.1 hypothetical protein [Streptomyces smaragdinus]